MSKRDEYQTRMEEHLNLWTARLEALASKAAGRVEHQKQLQEWRGKSIHAFAQLAELKATIGAPWDGKKLEMEKTWHALEAVLAPDAPNAPVTPAPLPA